MPGVVFSRLSCQSDGGKACSMKCPLSSEGMTILYIYAKVLCYIQRGHYQSFRNVQGAVFCVLALDLKPHGRLTDALPGA